jgi:trans-aconitate 2-methyltransferase
VSVTWDPTRYLAFAGERERPFAELVARVPTLAARLVVDLGCGPGTATAQLLERWPDARVVGVDSSPAMIARAARLALAPRLCFEQADLRTWEPDGPPDVVVTNAVLQWIPEQVEVIGRFASLLTPGGSLALQVPGNFGAPSHASMRELAASGRWPVPAGLLRESPVLEPAGYLSVLTGLGLDADVWETTYLHVLTGTDPVLDWVRGTALRPLLAVLGERDAASFEAAYAAALREVYPPDAAGRTLLPFRRIFAVGRRPGPPGG